MNQSEIMSAFIERLGAFSSMPPDEELSVSLLDGYDALLTDIRNSGLRDSRLIAPIIETFGPGEAYGVYWSTLHLLERFDWSDLIRELISAMTNPSAGVRYWSARMLGHARALSAADVLQVALHDESEIVREACTVALGLIDLLTFQDKIREMTMDKSELVATAAREMLSRATD
jgi:HEAT repeat protein